jgi:uncharacterized RDD family membrane protein YckC
MLDTTQTIQTPEGVELNLYLAGPIVRALAWAIDFVIRGVIYIVLIMIFARLGELGVGIFLILLFALEWFYPVVFEVFRDGATPGKKVMGILVLHENGTPVNWSASLVRNLLRVVDFLPFFNGFGLIAMLSNSKFQRLGDLAAGTVVVYSDKSRRKIRGQITEDISPLALPTPLRLDEQQALMSFAERADTLPVARQAELANILAPLTQADGETGSQRLRQMAHSLLGKRG